MHLDFHRRRRRARVLQRVHRGASGATSWSAARSVFRTTAHRRILFSVWDANEGETALPPIKAGCCTRTRTSSSSGSACSASITAGGGPAAAVGVMMCGYAPRIWAESGRTSRLVWHLLSFVEDFDSDVSEPSAAVLWPRRAAGAPAASEPCRVRVSRRGPHGRRRRRRAGL